VSLRRSEEGQAIVEFALVLPVLLATAFAIVLVAELGVARLALQHATAEGARAGALTNDDEAIRETVAAAVTPLPADRIHTAIEPPQSESPRNADPRGTLLTVRASYELPVPLGFAGLPSLVVNASSVRRIEWTP
jgi:Flp pilus assembly protein TadG